MIILITLIGVGSLFIATHLGSSYYFVSGKVINAMGEESRTIAMAFYDDYGIRLIVEDDELEFDERLAPNNTVLRGKYPKLSYILYLCRNGCKGYEVREKDFESVEIGSIVRAKTSKTFAEILEIVEEGVKPIYFLHANESDAMNVWRKAEEVVKMENPFSGLILKHFYSNDRYDWFVIITSLDFDKSTVRNTILLFNDSLKLHSVKKSAKPIRFLEIQDVRNIIRTAPYVIFRDCAIHKIGWYYICQSPLNNFNYVSNTAVVEGHFGLTLVATSSAYGEGDLLYPEMYREILKSEDSPEITIRKFLPDTNISWKEINADGNTMSASGKISTHPEVLHKYKISERVLFNPLVENETVFLLGERNIYAIDEDTGEILWTLDVEGRYYVLDNHLYVSNSSSIVGVDKALGRVAWSYNLSGVKSIHMTHPIDNPSDTIMVAVTTDEIRILNITHTRASEIGSRHFGRNITAVCLDASNNILYIALKEGTRGKLVAVELDDRITTLWMYNHWAEIKNIACKDGEVYLVDSAGLTAITNGEARWECDVGVNGISISRYIYASKVIGERGLVYINSDGEVKYTFKLPDGEVPGTPVTSKNVVILPSMKPNNYSKLYIIQDGTNIFELKHEGEISEPPKISVAYGKIYALFPYDDTHYAIYILGDEKAPEVVDLFNKSRIFAEVPTKPVKFRVWYHEKNLHRAIFAYRINNSWHYVEMKCGEEVCEVRVPVQPKNSVVEYRVILIDDVGNYRILRGEYSIE